MVWEHVEFSKATRWSVELHPCTRFFLTKATYLLTKELWSAGAGLFAAAFISIAPGYISRSVAGSYDNEGIAIFALQDRLFKFVIQLLERDAF